MKVRDLFALLLLAALLVPAMAQQTPVGSQEPAESSSQNNSQAASANSVPNSQGSSSPSSDQNLSARQPLEPDYHQGFWGKLNPFARKKYVQQQLAPIRNRVNELDDLTAANTKQIKDVDARAQEGIRQADAKATQADQHAIEAGNRAQQANETALQASNRLDTVEHVVGNIDQYQPAVQTEIRFRPGQTALSSKAKLALDDMTLGLQDQKGYIIEVQGFSPAGIQSSQAMANSVLRYLVEKNQVPVYRIFVLGMGNAKLPAAQENSSEPAHGNRVEISLLKNNVDQLGPIHDTATSGDTAGGAAQSTSSYGTSKPPAPEAASSNARVKAAPAYAPQQ